MVKVHIAFKETLSLDPVNIVVGSQITMSSFSGILSLS